MAGSTALKIPENRWDEAHAASLDQPELLRYRSNLLGADLAVTNFGGGNTSAKIVEPDPITQDDIEVLWVKGSGGDLGSMGLDGFATLYLDKLTSLEGLYRGREHEDEMVAYLRHCVFNLNTRAPSIDTSLHAFLPYAHVDHTHPDAVIAIAASKDSKRLTEDVFEGHLAWLPWQRPGFDLGLQLRACAADHPGIEGIILEGHGLFTWGDTSAQCYATTIDIIAKAARYLNDKITTSTPFGDCIRPALASENRHKHAAALMPIIRGLISGNSAKVGHFSDTPEVLEFVGSQECKRLAEIGTSCPDHFLRTKIAPMIIDLAAFTENGTAYLTEQLQIYQDMYSAYYQRCQRPDSPAMRDPYPVVFLIPGVGMVTFAKDKATARISAEFYTNAINVMRGAEAVSQYMGLDEQEAFDIEYWLLEEAKLKRMPPAKPLTGKVAIITGGAGGIGRATAERLLSEGACVALLDIDRAALELAHKGLASNYSDDRVTSVICDVTDETSVKDAVAQTLRVFGGLDIVVANAGLASSASVQDTSLDMWRQNYSVLTEGYFLIAREAWGPLAHTGGAIVFVASKNALAASPNASAYASAKAAELHLARCLALEGAPLGIRVNTVNPDAVLSGSKIWTGNWRSERAAAHGIEEDALEDHYRQRSLLKRAVLPEDVAETIAFLASERSGKSTGNIINVDGGNAAAFPR